MERLAVTLALDSAGCLATLSAVGHAGRSPAGRNVACAAASALLRTAARLLGDAGLVAEDGAARAPGEMAFAVDPVPVERREWLRGMTEFLVRGLSDVASEHPDEVALRLCEVER